MQSKKRVSFTLPSELILSILSRLPVKSLCKFKSVSKQWLHSIAKDPYFISMHKQFSSQQSPQILLTESRRPLEFYDLNFDLSSFNLHGSSLKNVGTFSVYVEVHDDMGVVILPSKRDIICFVCQNKFYVCNPSTQMTWELPAATRYDFRDIMNVGMGYVKERDEYVFMRLFHRQFYFDGGWYDPACEVLRLSDGKDCEWELINADCPFDIYDTEGVAVFVENVFYWYPYKSPEVIHFLDLVKEEFGQCSPPNIRDLGVLSWYWKLVEMDGSLCVVDYLGDITMDIWVMKDFVTRTWVLKHSIDMTSYGTDTNLWCHVIPVDYRDGLIWMNVDQQRIDFYDVENKCIKRMDRLMEGKSKLDRIMEGMSKSDRLDAGMRKWLQLYTESFFSLGSRYKIHALSVYGR